jgi:6-phosphofructokinase 2
VKSDRDARMSPATIVTVTLNPAIDVSTDVPHVVSDRKLRCAPPRYEPGGGGVNVARAIRRLGGRVAALFPAGGPAGRLLHELLEAEGVERITVPIRGFTRENLNVLERETGRQFRFVLPGPELSAEECEECFGLLSARDPFPAYLVGSGSLPPGAPTDFLARLARLARARGSRFVLDTSGPPLAAVLEESVFLWKPSLREFQEWSGESGSDETAWLRRARQIVADGRCEVLVVSLGPGGALWTSRAGQERLAAPAVSVASSVGAGDSLVAGIVFSLAGGGSVPEAVRLGVAAAAASVMSPGTGLCRREDVERLMLAVVPVTV